MKILYGPPGTGKTYRAAREAVRVIEPGIAEKDVEDRHRQLVAAGRIIWVTFHPSYAYEDFVEGFRPKVDPKTGSLIYAPEDGPFKLACTAARAPNYGFQPGQLVGKPGGAQYRIAAVEPGGLVLQKANPRGDGAADEYLHFADYWTVKRVRDAGLPSDVFSYAGADNEKRRPVAEKVRMPVSMFGGNSGKYVALYHALDSAPAPVPVVLVIDEINRADLSRVFGELMTLLEPDKRLGQREERRVRLPYSGELFGVPPEVSVIGTMNTADRSLAVLDVALRRRFEFEEVAPEPTRCPKDYGGVNVAALLGAINVRVEALRSRDNRIGHSDLMEGTLERSRLAHQQVWTGGDTRDNRLRALALVLRRRVVPLLLEYFAEDWKKAEVALGRRDLLEEVTYDHVSNLADGFLDEDLEGHTGFKLSPVWDPLGTDWDPAETRKRLNDAAKQT